MTTADRALALELALDRFEALLAPALDAHSAAVVAAARVGVAPPPWPELLRDPHAARLARDAAAHGDPMVAARARTLARWSLAARLAADVDVRAADRAPRTLAGLAARHDARRAAASRLGLAGPSALAAALYGEPIVIAGAGRAAATIAEATIAAATIAEATIAEATIAEATIAEATIVEATIAEATVAEATIAEATIAEAGRDDAASALPSWSALLAMLARHAGTPIGRVTVIADSAVAATVIAGDGVTCLLGGAGAASDAVGRLAVAAHELGHGVYAAGFAGLPLGLAAPPSRIFDEAIAAWAVAQVAPRRGRRAAHLHAQLARFEGATLGAAAAPSAAALETAWRATLGDRDPATVPSLFDEPGVAAVYARADRLRLAPGPGALARWAAQGAAFDPVAAGT